jgi:hypothetical protein
MDHFILKVLTNSTELNLPQIIKQFEEAPEFPSIWNETCLKLLKSLNIQQPHVIDVLLEVSVDRIVTKHRLANVWIGTLKFVVLYGFKLFHDSGLYGSWLAKMKNLFIHFKTIHRLENAPLYAPNVFNLIGTFCCISYIDRFTPMSVRNIDVDNQFSSIENELVQFVAKCDPSSVLFPLSFISSHVIDIATGPMKAARTLKRIMAVIVYLNKVLTNLLCIVSSDLGALKDACFC